MKRKLAVLAPEHPAVSTTFISREIDALRETGREVVTASVREPSLDTGEDPLVIYQLAPRHLLRFGRTLLRRPCATLFVLLRALAACVERLLRGGRLDARPLVQAIGGIVLAGWLLEKEVEHLHVHFAHVPATIGFVAAETVGISCSVMAHANDLFERPEQLQRKLRLARPFCTISRFNREWLHERFDEPGCGIEVIRMGVPKGMLELERAPVGEARRLLSIGRLVPKKGFDRLIDAFASLVEDHPGLELRIIGDGPERSRLAHQIETRGLAEHVTLLGSCSESEVREELMAADLFVLACLLDPNGDQDGIPVVLMEAMAIGVPVVTTRLSGIPELVRDGESGWLTEPGCEQSLAEGLRQALADGEERRSRAIAGKQLVRDQFTSEANARTLVRAIDLA